MAALPRLCLSNEELRANNGDKEVSTQIGCTTPAFESLLQRETTDWVHQAHYGVRVVFAATTVLIDGLLPG